MYEGELGAEGVEAGYKYETGLQSDLPTRLMALYLNLYVFPDVNPVIVYEVVKE